MNNEVLIIIPIFLIPGIGLIYYGLSSLIKAQILLKKGVKTTAYIAYFKRGKVYDTESGGYSYYPVISFKDTQGEKVEYELSSSQGREKRHITILYRKKKDGKYDVIRNSKFWMIKFPIMMIAFGLLISAIPTFVLLDYFKLV